MPDDIRLKMYVMKLYASYKMAANAFPRVLWQHKRRSIKLLLLTNGYAATLGDNTTET